MLELKNIPLNTAVVETPLIKIIRKALLFQVFLFCKDGSVIEHEPFPLTLEGLVAALSLSAEVCAGKFYLNRIIKDNSVSTTTLIAGKARNEGN